MGKGRFGGADCPPPCPPPLCRWRKVLASMDWKKSCRGRITCSGDFSCAATAPPRLSRQSNTVWYTASKTSRSRANFTWVLAGCTFTSTAVTGTVTDSTQPGNFPFIS